MQSATEPVATRPDLSIRKADRLKRRMVRQVVQENLDLIAGRPAVAAGSARRRQRILRLAALALLLPAGALLSNYAVTGDAVLGLGSRNARALPPAPPPSASPLPSSPSAGMPFPVASDPWAGADPALLALGAPIPASIDAGVFPLAVRRVMIDPGHGGGSLGTHTPDGLYEKDITLDIGLRVAQLLRSGGFEVLITREKDDFIALRERARRANEAAADVFLSIHVNYIDDGGGIRGVETYYLGATDDPYIERFAADENRDSGYTLGELRSLLDRIFSGVRISKSRDLATAVQSEMYRSLAKINPELRDRGVKSAPFLVLVDTRMPAILAEVSCLSNPREAVLLAQPLYRQFIAEALARGIVAYAGAASSAAKGS